MISSQSQISGPLAALMQLKQAEQTLKQSASPVTSSGQPTVASQAIQSAQALTQPGIEDLLPGVRQQAAMQAQAQQPVTQAQLAQAMQRAQPSQGIAAGPQDIGMAEGGIVGYNGEERSDVKSQAEEDREKILGVLTAIRDKGLLPAGAAIADVASAIPRGLLGAYNSAVVRPMRAAGIPAGYIPDIMGGDYSSATPFYDRFVRGGSEKPSGQASETVPDYTQDLGTPMPKKESSKKDRSEKQQTQGAAQSSSDKVGIAQLTQPSWISFLQAGLDANRAQVLPEKITEKRAEEIRREAMIRRGIDPDYYKVRQREIDELQAAYAKEEADRAKMVEGRGLENLIGFLTRAGGAKSLARGLGQASLGMESVVEKQRLSDQEFRRLMMERQKAIGDSRAAIQQFREAQALGDLKMQADSTKDYNEAFNKIQAANAKMFGDVVAPMIQSETAALDRASREKMEGMRLKQQAEQNNQMQLANRINAANITVSAAIEKMEGSLKKKYGATADLFRMLPKSEIDKKPELAASYAEYKKESEKMFAEMVEPAIAERNRLAAMVSGVGGNVQRYDSQGNPIK